MIKLSALVVGISVLFLCNNYPEVDTSNDYLIPIDSITIDTSFGYPFPSNYNWINLVQIAKQLEVPHKKSYSSKPLINYISDNVTEIYRINGQVSHLLIVTDLQSESNILSTQLSIVDSHNVGPLTTIDSISSTSIDYRLNNLDTRVALKLVKKIGFWSHSIFSENSDFPIMLDGKGYDTDYFHNSIEGIKDGFYNIVFLHDLNAKERKYFRELESFIYNKMRLHNKQQ